MKPSQLESSAAFGLQLDPSRLIDVEALSARPIQPVLASHTAGDPASKSAIRRLMADAETRRQQVLLSLINRALDALKRTTTRAQ